MELLYGLVVEAEIEVIKGGSLPPNTLKPGDLITVKGDEVTVIHPKEEEE